MLFPGLTSWSDLKWRYIGPHLFQFESQIFLSQIFYLKYLIYRQRDISTSIKKYQCHRHNLRGSQRLMLGAPQITTMTLIFPS